MLFSEFLEERKQDQIHAYHATDIKHLRSILKHGLVPNYSEGGYGSDEVNQFNVPLTPHPGVYFTKKAGASVHIAKGYDRGIILIAKVSPNSLTMDEDNLQYVYRHWMIIEILEDGGDFEDVWEYVTQTDIMKSVDSRYLSSLKDLFKRYVKAFKEYVEHEGVASFNSPTDGTPRSKEELLKNYKSVQYEMTKKLSRFVKGNRDIFSAKGENPEREGMTPHSEERNPTSSFKIDRTVGFSGRNRIVGIYDPIERVGWGDLGAFRGSEYHMYKTPNEFIEKKK